MSSLTESIGRYVAQVRNEHGLTLDNLATVSRKWGMTWTTTSIRNFENGKFALTLQNLTGLALVMGKVTGKPHRLVDLLGDTGDVGESFPQLASADKLGYLSREWLEGVLTGAVVEVGVSDYVRGGDFAADALTRAVTAMQAVAKLLPTDMSFEDIPAATPTLAEKRAAARLGERDDIVAVWARHLWGRSLDDEASARAGEGVSAQARGYATRALVNELRQRMEQDRGDD